MVLWKSSFPTETDLYAPLCSSQSLSRTSTIEDAGIEDEEYLEVRW